MRYVPHVFSENTGVVSSLPRKHPHVFIKGWPLSSARDSSGAPIHLLAVCIAVRRVLVRSLHWTNIQGHAPDDSRKPSATVVVSIGPTLKAMHQTIRTI